MTATLPNPKSGTPHPGPLPIAAHRGEGGKLVWRDHPLIDREPEYQRLDGQEARLLAEGWSHEDLLEHFDRREKRLADAERDPCNHEFPLPHWASLEREVLDHIVTFVPGGNNPGKSRWAASFVMRVLLRRIAWSDIASDGRVKVLMVAQDEESSRMYQQDKIYAQMPAAWRGLNERGLVGGKKPAGFAKSINYSDKNGFTEGNFVLPRPLKGQCWFKTVAQYIREPKSFEGPDYDLVIVDEGCPQPLLKSLQGRVAKRGGKIVYLLTCVNGYDAALGQALEGAKIEQTLPMQWVWTGEADLTQRRKDAKTQRPNDDKTPERIAATVLESLAGNKADAPYARAEESRNTETGASSSSAFAPLRLCVENHGGEIDPEIVYPELRAGEHQTDLLKRLGCPAGHMPYVMQPLNPQWKIVFMWNVWNPFQPRAKWNPKMPAMMDSCVGDPKWRVLVKMFGWIEKVGQLALGNFNPEKHVVRGPQREQLDAMVREGKASVYFGDDPETQRSHAGLWLAVFAPCPPWPKGLKYLFDETPRVNEGDWVDAAGARGEGQFCYRATGSNWYKRYLRQREREEWNVCDPLAREARAEAREGTGAPHPCVIQRRGDPRGFATEESTATGTRSLFELYLEDQSKEHPDFAPMVFVPAKIRRSSSLDIDNIINLLKYDEDRCGREGGFTAENTPELVVSERCGNFIRCALNYTLTDLGKADEDNPFRDFIDALRYLLAMPTPWIDPSASGVSGGGAWS